MRMIDSKESSLIWSEKIKKVFLSTISRPARVYFWLPIFVIIFIYVLKISWLPWLYSQGWSGLGASSIEKDFREKKLWDWMELFLVPAILIWGAWFLNRSERKSEKLIAMEQLQEASMLSYLDKMTELMLDKGLVYTKNEENRVVDDIARARTLTVLRGLDGIRKGIVIEFLARANLIDSNLTVINLFNADLQRIQLQNNHLGAMRLAGVNMESANLCNATLDNNNFSHANLRNANFANSNVVRLHIFVVLGTDNKIIPKGMLESFRNQEYSVNFDGADLTGANFESATLFRAIFGDANLKGTNFRNAELAGADLSRTNVTDEQLRECRCLVGSRLPSMTHYDGRFNLSGDISLAQNACVNINSPSEMKKWYSATYFKYRSGTNS